MTEIQSPQPAPRLRPGVERLWDSQWVNIVNAPEVLAAEDAREAVHLAVKLTEARMAANFAECMADADLEAICKAADDGAGGWVSTARLREYIAAQTAIPAPEGALREAAQQALETLDRLSKLVADKSVIERLRAALAAPAPQAAPRTWSPADRGEVAGDGKPCPNTHDPDCRWPNCNCRARDEWTKEPTNDR